jgi:primary-amine oxidase
VFSNFAYFDKMSAEVATEANPRSEKSVSSHPLSPLSASELQDAAAIIKASWPAQTDLHFKVVTLQEPPKVEVLKYLDAEHSGAPVPSIPRKAFVNYYIRNTVRTRDLEEKICN